MKEILSTTAAPAAIGPYSQGVKAGGLCFLSGMLALNPATGTLVGKTAGEQTVQILQNITALLASAGLRPEHVVKTTVFLADLSDFATVNEAYAAVFAADAPARSCVEVSRLPKGALVEIECIAVAE